MNCFQNRWSSLFGSCTSAPSLTLAVSCSLQQENEELKATVAELQCALETERRRKAALEICLKNAERSRDEAQKRNNELQRDIQRFLTKEPQAPT